MKACVIALMTLGALAGAAEIGGPVSGYVLDPAGHSLRPINGMPGSATLGSPVTVSFAVGMAAASVRQDYALLAGARGEQVYVAAGLRSGQPSVAPLDGAISVSGMALSGSGTAAILYSDRSRLLQFVSGLPGQPQTGAPVDIGVAGRIVAIAPDAAGTAALLVGADGSLYSVAAGAAPQFIARIPGASSAALMPNGSDALVGNRDSGDILLVRNFAGAGSIGTLAGARDGITSAVAVAAVDGSHAAAIDASGRMAVIDLDTAVVTWVALAGAAERLDPLDNGLLLLNQAGPQALLLFDTARGGSAFFVPPGGNSPSRQGTAIWMRH